jgi:hypothetical protein
MPGIRGIAAPHLVEDGAKGLQEVWMPSIRSWQFETFWGRICFFLVPIPAPRGSGPQQKVLRSSF